MAFLPYIKFHITCGASIYTTPSLYHILQAQTISNQTKKCFIGANVLFLLYLFVKHFYWRLEIRIVKKGKILVNFNMYFGIILPQN